MQRIRVAEHQEVRLLASPPPRALDNQQLLAVEGSKPPPQSHLSLSRNCSEEPQLSAMTAGTPDRTRHMHFMGTGPCATLSTAPCAANIEETIDASSRPQRGKYVVQSARKCTRMYRRSRGSCTIVVDPITSSAPRGSRHQSPLYSGGPSRRNK